MASTLQSGQSLEARVKWIDAHGNPAQVQSTEWESTDDSILTVEADTQNQNQAIVTSAGPIGSAQIHVTADADLGEGVQSITAVAEVTVIAGQATGGEIELRT